MDTNRLRYFCTVCKTVNVHRAAELLHLSPAALSKSIKILESELGIPLLVPSGRGIAITDEGRAFAGRAQRILDDLERLRASAKENKEAAAPLRLGSFEVFTTHALVALVKEALGGAELTLHELAPGKLEEAIQLGQVDLGVTYLPIPHPDLDFLKAATLSMGVYTRKGPLQQMKVPELPFAIPAAPLQGTPSKVVGLDGWPDNLVKRSIRYRVTLMESALELCRQGQAAAFLPRFVVELHNQKVREPFQLHPHPGPLPLSAKYLQQAVYLVKRKSNLETQPAKKIAKALRVLCR